MKKDEAKVRIEKLKEVIAEHRYNYHVLDKQTISDSALDSLKHELYTLEQAFPECITPDSPTQRVAGESLEQFEKITHVQRMLSMEDVFTLEEFEAWKLRAMKVAGQKIQSFFCMPKIDGLAVSLVYIDGLLETAATRGDGSIGEDVTQNIKTIESIPLKLQTPPNLPFERGGDIPHRVEVRGEIYIPVKAFEKLNAQQKKEGKPEFANPRNTAAGSIRQLDPKIAASRGLAFVGWDLVADFGQTTMEEEWNLLRELGFKPAPESVLLHSAEEITNHWNVLQKKRDTLDYWVDGMVVRVDENQVFENLGVVGKTPRGLVAWKFPAEEATTVVKRIEWFVGRTGALTPVALLEPTWIGGTTVQHASLHNLDEIERLDIREGDTVILFKAGDIIPKIKEVLKGLRPERTQKVVSPLACPVCGSSVERKEGEVAFYCTNRQCFVQESEAILHASRAFEIDGLGPQTIATLLEQKIINRPSDLFLLKPDDLLGIEGFAELSSKKLVEEIQSKKTIELDGFILGLGIRNVGEQTAIDLAHHFKTLENFLSSTKESLEKIEGVGDVVAESIRDYLDQPHHQELVRAYLDAGVYVKAKRQLEINEKIAGKTFVITGTLETLSRDEAKERIREGGGKVSGSVSSKTDYVIVGESPGSKADEARELGISTLSEQEFIAKLDAN